MKKYFIIALTLFISCNSNAKIEQKESIIKTINTPPDSRTKILGIWYDNSDGTNSKTSYWEFKADGKLYVYTDGVLESVSTFSISHSCGQNSDPKYEFLKLVDEDGSEFCAEINGINGNNSGILSLTSMSNFEITILVNDINIVLSPRVPRNDPSALRVKFLRTLTLTPKSSSLYQHDGYDNSDISYPWDINEKITTLLDNFLHTDDLAFVANTTCGKYLADYKVKTESSHLVSLEKTVSGTSCSTPLITDTEYFNFFETDYGAVYSVNIKKNSYIISEINKLATSKTSCNYNSSSTKAYLFFDANKPKLAVKNQSCSDIIDLDVSKLEFVFTDTSVNLIKNNTYILD